MAEQKRICQQKNEMSRKQAANGGASDGQERHCHFADCAFRCGRGQTPMPGCSDLKGGTAEQSESPLPVRDRKYVREPGSTGASRPLGCTKLLPKLPGRAA